MIEENYSDYQDLYQAIEQFPVRFSNEDKEQLDNAFWREDKDLPYISIEYDYGVLASKWGRWEKAVFADCIYTIQPHECRVFRLKFHSMEKGYTVSYHIYDCSDDWFVEWGNWTDSDELELKVTNRSGDEYGVLKMRVYIKENPEICAYICYPSR